MLWINSNIVLNQFCIELILYRIHSFLGWWRRSSILHRSQVLAQGVRGGRLQRLVESRVARREDLVVVLTHHDGAGDGAPGRRVVVVSAAGRFDGRAGDHEVYGLVAALWGCGGEGRVEGGVVVSANSFLRKGRRVIFIADVGIRGAWN